VVATFLVREFELSALRTNHRAQNSKSQFKWRRTHLLVPALYLGSPLVLRSGYEWRGGPQAVSRESHRTRNKNKQTNSGLGVVLDQYKPKPKPKHGRSRSMLVEVSVPCGTASNTLRPKRLPIHIGSAGERARLPVQSFFVYRPNEPITQPNRRSRRQHTTEGE
jgi:hypothetical protein